MNDGFTDDDDAEITFLGCAALIAQAIDTLEGRSELLSLISFKHAESGQFDAALDLVETINDSYLKDQALAVIAAKCIQAGEADYADKVADMIEDDAAYAVATEQMAVAYAESGALEKALEAAQSLADSDPTLSRIALVCVASGLLEQALELAQSIESADLKAPVLVELAAKALADGRKDEARELLLEATAATEEIEFFFEQRISTLVTIAILHKKGGGEEQALEVLSRAHHLVNESEDKPARDAGLAQIAGAFAELQHYDRADQTIEEIEDPLYFARATISVALEYHKAGDSTKALSLLTQAIEIVRDEDVYGEQTLLRRENLLDDLADGCATAGHYEEALQAIGLMKLEESQDRSLGKIAILAVTSGNHDRRVQVVELIKDSYARVVCEVQVVDAFIAAEQMELADHALVQVPAAIAAIERAYQKSWALMGTAPRFARRGQSTKAAEILFEALTTLALIDGNYLQAHALINLAGKYLELGQQPGEREQKVLGEITRKLD